MKNDVIRYSFALALCGLVPLSSASAGITYIFSPSGDGGVDVVGSGTGISDRVLPVTSFDWDVQDFVTNFMSQPGTATIGADTESGTFANVTTGASESIITFAIDEDGGASFDNDIDFDTAASITFNLGDEMSFSLTAHFLPSSLTMSDLVVGTHIDEGHTTGAGIAEESFGITTVRVIPEPSSMAIASFCLVAAAVARRRLKF